MTTSSSKSNNAAPHLSSDDLELLSAYLDNQLAVPERVTIERRLHAEPTLHTEFHELQTTIRLLHELPSLPPPRSFTLDPASRTKRQWWGWVQARNGIMVALLMLMTSGVILVELNMSREAKTDTEMAADSMEVAEVAPMLLTEEGVNDGAPEEEQPPVAAPAEPDSRVRAVSNAYGTEEEPPIASSEEGFRPPSLHDTTTAILPSMYIATSGEEPDTRDSLPPSRPTTVQASDTESVAGTNNASKTSKTTIASQPITADEEAYPEKRSTSDAATQHEQRTATSTLLIGGALLIMVLALVVGFLKVQHRQH